MFASLSPAVVPESIFPLREILRLGEHPSPFCLHSLLNSCVADSVLPKTKHSSQTAHKEMKADVSMPSSLRNPPLVWCLPPPETGSPTVCLVCLFARLQLILNDLTGGKRNISTSDHHLTSPTNSNQSAQHQQLMKHEASKANTTNQKYLCFRLDYLHKTLAGDETNPLSQQKQTSQ